MPSSSTVPARTDALAARPGVTSVGTSARRAGVSRALITPQTVANRQINGMVSTPAADASA
jgi:hypothetical protein